MIAATHAATIEADETFAEFCGFCETLNGRI
jgi:hypothetical protein